VCYNASAGTPRSQYTTQACEQFFDTECANCSACNWSTEFELIPCSETDDATCSPITYNRECPTGFYAGGHTRTSDSQCLPCAVHNTQYEGQWLHEFTSAGREYNNRFSCDLQCRPYSRLINNSDPSLGCTTCEVGNVLFKIFTQDTFACKFICLEGYVPVNGDCVLAAAEGNELTFWNHSLNVTHCPRLHLLHPVWRIAKRPTKDCPRVHLCTRSCSNKHTHTHLLHPVVPWHGGRGCLGPVRPQCGPAAAEETSITVTVMMHRLSPWHAGLHA